MAKLSAAPFALALSIPLSALVGIALGGVWIAVMPVMLFVLVPILDVTVGHDTRNPDPDAARPPMADLALYAWVPVQLAIVAWFCRRAGAGAYTTGELAALAATVGLMSGTGIVVAHELMHRASASARAAAEILMTSVCYPHFCVEHVHGHHRNVATPLDPASARKGESLFAFWSRTLHGSLASAWRIESSLVRRGRKRRSGVADRRVRYPLAVIVAVVSVGLFAGGVGMVAFAAQSLVAVLLLETINYIEHYGLARREVGAGRYERVRPEHSWNASHRVSNWYLFNLQRHSDHHYAASRPYWQLRHHDGVPQLPFSYPAALLAALVPPLWRRVMDPRVDAWRSRTAEEAAEER